MKINFKYKDCDIEIIATTKDKYYFDYKINLYGTFNGFKTEIRHKYNGYCLFIEDEYFGIFDNIYADYELYGEEKAISVLENDYEKLISIYREVINMISNHDDNLYQLFYNFSNEEIEFIESNIGTEYQDNIRVGVEGDENSMNAYTLFRSLGCCGFSDKIFEFNNKKFHIGYNYGH